MHPASSVIFFTTASGAGYGLLFLMGLAGAAGLVPADRWSGLVGFALALGLITAGLLASTFHLGHPERAWRAMSQWRSSWLSREGMAAVVTYLPALIFALGWIVFEDARGFWGVFGILASAGAVVTVVCTGMIYASLRTIRQWRHPLVLPGYLLFALYTGGMWMTVLVCGFGGDTTFLVWVTLIAGAGAAAVKWTYWSRIDSDASVTTAGTATGLGHLGKVRMLDAPTTSKNFVMREMGYRVARKHVHKLRMIAVVAAIVVPFALLMVAGMMATAGGWIPALLAAVIGTLGVAVERWLFFAQATHVVTTYYGAEAA